VIIFNKTGILFALPLTYIINSILAVISVNELNRGVVVDRSRIKIKHSYQHDSSPVYRHVSDKHRHRLHAP
jgi:hypothetical protein